MSHTAQRVHRELFFSRWETKEKRQGRAVSVIAAECVPAARDREPSQLGYGVRESTQRHRRCRPWWRVNFRSSCLPCCSWPALARSLRPRLSRPPRTCPTRPRRMMSMMAVVVAVGAAMGIAARTTTATRGTGGRTRWYTRSGPGRSRIAMATARAICKVRHSRVCGYRVRGNAGAALNLFQELNLKEYIEECRFVELE